MSEQAEVRIRQLSDLIRRHDQLYYVEGRQEISDLEYDRLIGELEALELEYPAYLLPSSPSQRIGDAPADHLQQAAHAVPMLSIDNTYQREDLQAYFERTVKTLDDDAVAWIMEFKIDGVAASVRYEKGVLVQALTRGNGRVGDDITHNIRTVRDLPLELLGDDPPAVLEVRGEVYMTNADLADLNVRQADSGAEPFKNTRNVTAGTIRLLDPAIAAQRNLRFFCHGVGEVDGLTAKTHLEFLDDIRRLGIPTTPGVRRFNDWKEAAATLEDLERQMPDLPFEVDGIVFKIDRFETRDRLGIRSKSPRWLIAYKHERYEAVTQVREISVQVGKTGTITPVAHLEPVDIADTTVSRASLHNADEIARLDVRIGDTVVVEKAGKIIPKVVRVEKHARSQPLPEFDFPTRCPACAAEVARDPGGVYIRCLNPTCPAQIRGKLVYFGSRTGMDIDGLGEEVIDLLLANRLVTGFADLYGLTVQQLADLKWPKKRRGKDGELIEVQFGRKNAENLFHGIQQSRGRGLARLLASISIRHVGPTVATLVTRRYWTMDALIKATPEDLAGIHEVGERIAESLHSFLHSDYGERLIDDLRDAGVTLEDPEPPPQDSDAFPLGGKSVVVTGTLKKYKRDEIKRLILALGGRPASTVSKSTDFLVAGEKAGSKLTKAKSLGVNVLTEEEFQTLIPADDPAN